MVQYKTPAANKNYMSIGVSVRTTKSAARSNGVVIRQESNLQSTTAYSFCPLPPSVKRQKTSGQFATKRQRKINQIVNSPRTKQHICKPLNPSHNQSLQKSYFFADALII
ncbi:MAG: hypothetical protein A2W86_14145 [Bacteroidetes bacterium GWD2_45_23]|jgi:hypothetical protein|nr:MAG: hypothetical protein A2W87_03575 [Bacteroidetes bacterium GWC2_46_850]OFX84778.1 MAG: hypothetical protein A2W86_14145 [Bacteroidetes bacterium GWD2_45_23]HBB01006.1 hypothetical protein [Porphyromonadaceae bacterium]HCC18863.1 hypothetical protein [Porphyromonadaceae bacterium]